MLLNIIPIVCALSIAVVEGVSLLEQLNFIASQNQFAAEMFQVPFALENIMGASLDMAMQSCQESFKWNRWNCPSTNFYVRHAAKPLLIDREDAYVYAITTAAILYTITKNCASGIITDCGVPTTAQNMLDMQVSDDPQKAIELYEKHVNTAFSGNIYGAARQHNYKTVTTLLKQSLVKQCGCRTMSTTGCIEELCLDVLKPFAEIACAIRQMYEEGIQLDVITINMQVIWKNVPLDSLVYTRDSPNYCEIDAILHWNGVRGRQCSQPAKDDQSVSWAESQSCQHICTECDYKVRSKEVIIESACNCKLSWELQWHCEMCVKVQRQYYCY